MKGEIGAAFLGINKKELRKLKEGVEDDKKEILERNE